MPEIKKPKIGTKEKIKSDFKLAEPDNQKANISTKSDNDSPSDFIKSKTLNKKNSDKKVSNAADQLAGHRDVFNKFLSQVGDAEDEIPNDEEDFYSDEEFNDLFGTPDEPEPSTDIATISKELTTGTSLDLNWHQIKDLPGYTIKQIRAAFRPLFNNLFSSQLEDISVVTTLTSSKEDVTKFMNIIMNKGSKVDDFSLDAFDIDPEEYHIEKGMVYDWNDTRFLLLKENLGGMINLYVYAAPRKSSSNSGLLN